MIKEANHQILYPVWILWTATFSPAKMWINGLNILFKPFAHLHTQYNASIPWSSI
ncbi:MAG: hypothetical protein IPP42_04790 [Saprospiraceae bacterium]|nr:hypothetical protein [Saprospiraceae bacterium]